MTASADAQVQDVVGHPALVIARNVEWGTVIFGFEQANKYTIYDQEGNVIALLAEELGSFGKEVGRCAAFFTATARAAVTCCCGLLT